MPKAACSSLVANVFLPATSSANICHLHPGSMLLFPLFQCQVGPTDIITTTTAPGMNPARAPRAARRSLHGEIFYNNSAMGETPSSSETPYTWTSA